jgi:formylglycine-generating enzyme required for sulfatase activity
MNIISFSAFSFLALCILLCTACSNDTPYKADLSQIQRSINITRDSLGKELWLEVEKNEVIKLCLDSNVRTWESSLNSKILNDSCLTFQVPTLIGVDTIKVYFLDSDSSHNINLAVGMKYFDFKNEEVLLGFNKYQKGSAFERFLNSSKIDEDKERLNSITGTYLIDKYPVTNCEITQLMWDSIPTNPSFKNKEFQEIAEQWSYRKKNSIRNEKCIALDTAASTVSLHQAMKYANARSIREGLKPYYIFSAGSGTKSKILSRGNYIIGLFDLSKNTDWTVKVSVDFSSDGYRLPYYDEWMMFARGGDKKNDAPWGDSSVAFEETAKYARFATWKHYFESEPVGQLLPNGYGLYDMFGLVWEHVLFEEINPFKTLQNRPSCLKGGDNHVELDHESSRITLNPYWKWINYGYNEPNYSGGYLAGFRLIRNIGNNAKWTEVKAPKNEVQSNKQSKGISKDLSSISNSPKNEPQKRAVPKPDTANPKRKQKKIVFDGYIKPISRDILFGTLSDKGSVEAKSPAIPRIDKIANDWIRSFFANSDLARAAKVWVIKHPKTKVKRIKARITLLKSDSTSYGFNPVEIELYKKGEEGGFYVFQTMTNSKGKPLLFSEDESDAGNYEDAVILCLKNESDIFYYEMLE